MTEELKQAAQQDIGVLQHYIQGGTECRKPTEAEIASLRRPLTQRPAAQATPDHVPDAGKMMQATPEPVGEPFGQVTVRRLSRRHANHVDQYQFYPAGQLPYLDNVDECHTVYTRPAPGVPEGFALVPVKATPKVAMVIYEGARNCFSPKVAEGLWQDALAAAQAKGADK